MSDSNQRPENFERGMRLLRRHFYGDVADYIEDEL